MTLYELLGDRDLLLKHRIFVLDVVTFNLTYQASETVLCPLVFTTR